VLQKDGEDQLDQSYEKSLKEQRDILHTTERRKADRIGHILGRNCFLKHVIEGKVGGAGVKGRQRKRHQQLVGDLNEKRGDRKLKEEALVAPCGELALQESTGLSSDRLRFH
jgi:hypothetical protein